MQINPELLQDNEIFNPGITKRYTEIIGDEKKFKFAYYAEAETAFNILKNREIWFRNVTLLNDFSEVEYGMELLNSYIQGQEGKALLEILSGISPEACDTALKRIGISEMHWRFETYIACLTLHDSEKEDEHGRLSMWRAYGNTALVINQNPLMKFNSALGVFSFPISYLTKDEYFAYLSKVTESIRANKDYLKTMDNELLVRQITGLFFRLCVGVKHPGFEEEKEWRLYYQPTISEKERSKVMKKAFECIRGVPQKVYKLQLQSNENIELDVFDLHSDLHKIIIGPSSFPHATASVFQEKLEEHNIIDWRDKVVVSKIPLRV